MNGSRPLGIIVVALSWLVFGSSTARADQVEVGTTLTSLTIGVGDNDGTVLGIPSSGLGMSSPGGIYATWFTGPQFAVEPQLGLVWVSQNGSSAHVLSFAAQFDYFPAGTGGPYLFGSLGVIDTSRNANNPATASIGLGYRMPVGGRLVFRLDGRVLHVSDNGGNALVLGLSIGGTFGR